MHQCIKTSVEEISMAAWAIELSENGLNILITPILSTTMTTKQAAGKNKTKVLQV